MTILAIQDFTGERPRVPRHLLPDNAAAVATNCNLAHGELRSLPGPGPKLVTSAPVRSLFTDDGVRFFAWPLTTRAFLSPTIDDVHGRVYYANADGFFVTQANQMRASGLNPGAPTTNWNVGVAAPTVAPTLSVYDSPTWKSDPTAAAQIKLFWEVEGRRESELNVTAIEAVRPWREYLLTVDGTKLPEGSAASGESLSKVYVQAVRYRNAVLNVATEGTVELGPEQETEINGDVALIDGAIRTIDDGTRYPTPGPYGASGELVLIKKNDYWFTYAQLAANLKSGEPVTEPGTESPADGGKALAVEFSVNTPAGDRLLTMHSATSAQEDTGSTRGAVIGEQVSETQYRVFINYEPVESIAYVTTAQNDWGEESAASPPAMIDIDPVQNVKIVQPYVGLAGGRPVAGFNIYRTFKSNQSADLFLLNGIPLTTTEGGHYMAVDGYTTVPTTTVLKSAAWDTPPAGLANLTYVGNGFFAASKGKDLHFSEPYRPHAWPYSMTFAHHIVGIVAVEGGILVTTHAQPYLVYGGHPSQMSQQEVNAEQAGVSARSLTRVEGEAIYASNDGLVAVSGGQASLAASQQLFTRRDWRNRYKSRFANLLLGAHDGMALGLLDGGAVEQTIGHGFMIRLDEAPSYGNLFFDDRPIGMSVAAVVDTLYLGFADGFAEFGVGEDLYALWQSKDFVYPRPIAFGAAKLQAWGTWTVTLRANGGIVFSKEIDLEGVDMEGAEHSFRLPPLRPYARWSVELYGRGRVRSFAMGASFAELKDV